MKPITFRQYRCHKIVEAFEIGKIEGNLIFDKNDPEAAIEVSGDYLNKHPLNQPGYFVRYEDGYVSFSPKKALEDGYALLEDLSSIDAIIAAENGCEIRRRGHPSEINCLFQLPLSNSIMVDKEGSDFDELWQPTQEDIFTKDWYIVSTPVNPS